MNKFVTLYTRNDKKILIGTYEGLPAIAKQILPYNIEKATKILSTFTKSACAIGKYTIAVP